MALMHSPCRELASNANEPHEMENFCPICKELLTERQEILIISKCGHEFHKNCIENVLASSSECPSCKCSCELVDLRVRRVEVETPTNSSKPKSGKAAGTKPRGAMAKKHFTRNSAKNCPQDFLQPINWEMNASNTSVHTESEPIIPTRNINAENINTREVNNRPQLPPQNNSQAVANVDYSRLSQMIENTLSRLLRNGIPTPAYGLDFGNSPRPNNHPYEYGNHFFEPPRRPAVERQLLLDPNYDVRAEKITSIIQNWNVKFDGSSNGLSVEEFLYRVRSLTSEHFNGDFNVICKNLPILLTGKARDWYWRYHKQVDSIKWNDFCAALKYQYKDFRSNFDVREDIRNRKMKHGESFESFYESICSMLDKLETPIPESELVEILTRNLRPDIRHQLLYVPIYSIAHLRKLVQMREHFLSDESVRRQIAPQNVHNMGHRRIVAEIDFPEETTKSPSINTELSVAAIKQTPIVSKCWNCDEVGHHWEDCIRDRMIFCYGCGLKQVYKPQCPRCLAKKTVSSKN